CEFSIYDSQKGFNHKRSFDGVNASREALECVVWQYRKLSLRKNRPHIVFRLDQVDGDTRQGVTRLQHRLVDFLSIHTESSVPGEERRMSVQDSTPEPRE